LKSTKLKENKKETKDTGRTHILETSSLVSMVKGKKKHKEKHGVCQQKAYKFNALQVSSKKPT
jgi:hypothetical protein